MWSVATEPETGPGHAPVSHATTVPGRIEARHTGIRVGTPDASGARRQANRRSLPTHPGSGTGIAGAQWLDGGTIEGRNALSVIDNAKGETADQPPGPAATAGVRV